MISGPANFHWPSRWLQKAERIGADAGAVNRARWPPIYQKVIGVHSGDRLGERHPNFVQGGQGDEWRRIDGADGRSNCIRSRVGPARAGSRSIERIWSRSKVVNPVVGSPTHVDDGRARL